MNDYFNDWKAQNYHEERMEFEDLRFLPNDPKYILRFIEEQDGGNNAQRMLGKSLDVIEEWAKRYKCNIECLKNSKMETHFYLPQLRISE